MEVTAALVATTSIYQVQHCGQILCRVITLRTAATLNGSLRPYS